jgi:uncharacterized membrane protein YgdD (TMEM256/DUF423 family)
MMGRGRPCRFVENRQERTAKMQRWAYILMALAALSGMAGVIEAAAAAHVNVDPLLQTSSNFLLLMGTATIAIAAFALVARHCRAFYLVAGSILLAGSSLFCYDLTMRVFFVHKLFDLAAPIGGTLMIGGWLAAALAALASLMFKEQI